MENGNWIEVPVFIHGITPDADPQGHSAQYAQLDGLIREEFSKWNRKRSAAQEDKRFDKELIPVEWGQFLPSDGVNLPDELLAKAEHRLLEAVIKSEHGLSNLDPTINPARAFRGIVRAVIFQGIADLFYYASREGEIVIREHVFSQIANHIRNIGGEKKISLTFITHSAGTIIGHDLLYQLFRSEEVMKVKVAAGEAPYPAVTELREMISKGQLRVRRFYTLGSPIAPLVMRSTGLIMKSLTQEPLRRVDIGLQVLEDLPGYRWVNFWDKDDFASYPLRFLYEDGVVEDKYVDVGDSILLDPAHNLYWQSRPLAVHIAENW